MTDDAGRQDALATVPNPERRLSRAEFQGLGQMPPELEWFANLDNPRTRRAYRIDVKEFTAFAGVECPEEMRQITRAHLIALAQRPRAPRPGPQFDPPKARRGRLAFRPPVRS